MTKRALLMQLGKIRNVVNIDEDQQGWEDQEYLKQAFVELSNLIERVKEEGVLEK